MNGFNYLEDGVIKTVTVVVRNPGRSRRPIHVLQGWAGELVSRHPTILQLNRMQAEELIRCLQEAVDRTPAGEVEVEVRRRVLPSGGSSTRGRTTLERPCVPRNG